MIRFMLQNFRDNSDRRATVLLKGCMNPKDLLVVPQFYMILAGCYLIGLRWWILKCCYVKC